MIRVYIDWNILTNLKNPQQEPYKSILGTITQHKDQLLIPYSPAHLADLLKGWDGSEEKKAITQKDLKLISEITNNHLIAQYWKAPGVKPDIRDPEEFFEEFKQDKNQSLAEIMDFSRFADDFDEDTKKKFEGLMEQMNAIQLDYGQNSESVIEQMQKAMPGMPIQKPGQPFMEFLKEFGVYMDSLMKGHESYGNLRSMLRENLKLDTNISNWEKPYDKLDEYLPKTLLEKSLTEQIEEATKKESTNTSANKLFDTFLHAYAQLDMYGYHPEKLSKKNTYENMTNDGQHAFYAAHCDFFVTNDKRTTAKTSALYEKYEIKTVICNAEEFVEKLTSALRNTSSYADFINDISASAKKSVQDKTFEQIEFNSLPRFKIPLDPKVLNFFNTLLQTTFPNYHSHILARSPQHYGHFIFFREIEAITNEIVRLLGPDMNQKANYDPSIENKMINDGKWGGRRWLFSDSELALTLEEGAFLLVLFDSIKYPHQTENEQTQK